MEVGQGKEGKGMSQMTANKSSKLLKALGLIALIGVVIAVGRLIVKGVRSAGAGPDDEQTGV